MRLWITALALLGLASGGLTACAPKAQEDCGFVQNVYGERISWKGQIPVVLHLHESYPDEYVGALKAAIQSWNQTAGKTVLVLQDGPKLSTEGTARDRQNVISFSSNWEPDRLSEQARTSVHWVGDQIQEADVKVNAAKRANNAPVFNFYWETPSSPAVNLEALLLHELGHVLGLKHKDKDQSVMATYLASNDDRTRLAETDGNSLQCEY